LAAPSQYAGAFRVAYWMIPSSVFTGIYYWGASLLHLTKRTNLIGRIIVLSAILNLLLNYALVPDLGWLGAALATDISTGVAAIGIVATGLRYQPVAFEARPLGAALAVTLGSFAAVTLSVSLPWSARLGVVVLLCVASLSLARWCGIRLEAVLDTLRFRAGRPAEPK
jgi:O-antigen/teichoic acid export membrane protein